MAARHEKGCYIKLQHYLHTLSCLQWTTTTIERRRRGGKRHRISGKTAGSWFQNRRYSGKGKLGGRGGGVLCQTTHNQYFCWIKWFKSRHHMEIYVFFRRHQLPKAHFIAWVITIRRGSTREESAERIVLWRKRKARAVVGVGSGGKRLLTKWPRKEKGRE